MSDFRSRLARGDCLAGTFVKTPHPHVVEVLGATALDCLVLDAEHAPFDRAALDLCLLAARAAGKPVLVRPPSAAAEHILNALDGGADGVLLPHIRTPADAASAVCHCHYGPGGRGYAGSTRPAGYGRLPMAQHRANAAGVLVLAQIEDVEAVDAIDAIAATPGLDALFVGRADLTVALGCQSMDDPPVIAAVQAVVEAGRRHGIPTGMFLARAGDVPEWRAMGASLFLLQSDHGFLQAGADSLAAVIRGDSR